MKNAGVTSMMLIIAIISTLFYQTFDNIHIHILRVPDDLKY